MQKYKIVTPQFLMDCEHRTLLDDEAPAKGYVCKLMSEPFQQAAFTNPWNCATCRASGDINQAFLATHLQRIASQHLEWVRLGFVQDEQGIETELRALYPYLKSDKMQLRRIADSLIFLVNQRRLSLAKSEEMIKDFMKELLDESLGQATGSSQPTQGNNVVAGGKTGGD